MKWAAQHKVLVEEKTSRADCKYASLTSPTFYYYGKQ